MDGRGQLRVNNRRLGGFGERQQWLGLWIGQRLFGGRPGHWENASISDLVSHHGLLFEFFLIAEEPCRSTFYAAGIGAQVAHHRRPRRIRIMAPSTRPGQNRTIMIGIKAPIRFEFEENAGKKSQSEVAHDVRYGRPVGFNFAIDESGGGSHATN